MSGRVAGSRPWQVMSAAMVGWALVVLGAGGAFAAPDPTVPLPTATAPQSASTPTAAPAETQWPPGGQVPAGAAEIPKSVDDSQGSANPWLQPLAIRDSTGVLTSAYTLSLGGSQGLTPAAAADGAVAMLARIGWGFYVLAVSVGLWIFDWAIQLQILSVLDPIASVVQSVISSVIFRLGLISLLIALAFLSMVRHIAAGRAVAAITGMVVSLLTAAFMVSPASNLTGALIGESGGLMMARDVGLKVVSELVVQGGGAEPQMPAQTMGPASPAVAAANASAQAEEVRVGTTAQLATALIRGPHQIINYGTYIDGSDAGCAPTYNELVRSDAGAEDARTRMGECNEAYGTAANTPLNALIGVAFVSVGGGLVIVVALTLAVVLTLLVTMALWQSAKTTLELLKAILPGTSRTSALAKFAMVGVALFCIVGVLAGIGVFVLVTRSIFTESTNPVLGFIILDIILLVSAAALVAVIMQARRSSKKIGNTLGKAASPQPRSATSSGAPSPMKVVASRAGSALTTRMAIRSSLGASGLTGHPGQGDLSPVDRMRQAMGKTAAAGQQTVRTGGRIAAAPIKYTLGAPVYIPRAAGKAADAAAAKKATVMATIDDAKTRASRKKGEAAAFADEYVRGVRAAAAAPGKAARATRDAAATTAVAATLHMGPSGAGDEATQPRPSHVRTQPGPQPTRPPSRAQATGPGTTTGPRATTVRGATTATAIPDLAPAPTSAGQAQRNRLLDKVRSRTARGHRR